VTAAVKASLTALANSIEARIDSLALAVQSAIDPVAPDFDTIGGVFAAMCVEPLRASIAACIDAVAAFVQAVFDPVAADVPAVFDAIAAVAGVGQACAQQQGQGEQGHCFHRAVSSG
jgi:hypothetical protein